jgi:hypothetical protein
MVRTTFELKPVPPFRLDLTVWTLRRRAHNIVDRWDGATYRRVLTLPSGPVEVAVTQVAPLIQRNCESPWWAGLSVPRSKLP